MMKNTLYCFFLIFPLILQGQTLQINHSHYDSLHSFLLESNLTHYGLYFKGEAVFQWQSPECNESEVGTASLVKSITGLAVGELLENGFIESLDEPVCNYIPEWEDGCAQGVTIKHLLTMTSGILTKPIKERAKFFTTNDWNSFVLKMKLDTTPGARWSYSNEAGQLLEPIIARASKMDVQEFYDKYLLNPLHMKNTHLLQDSAGNYSTIGGAKTQMEDLANLGIAVLQGGKLDGKQVIAPSFLKEALTPIPQNNYYGYLWWVDPTLNTYTAMGDGGVMVIIYPDKDLVFVRANNCKTGPDPMRWMGQPYVQKIGEIVK